jgi:hypothetical protein
MKKISIHETLITRMAAYRGQQLQIARDTGLSQSTVSRASRGEGSPTLAVVEPIMEWMDKQDALKKRRIGAGRIPPATPRLRQKHEKNNANQGDFANLAPSAQAHV